jgi:hypothetical protein
MSGKVLPPPSEITSPQPAAHSAEPPLRATMPEPNEHGEYRLTVFPDAKARRKKELRLTGDSLRDLITSESAPRKEDLPWIKLAQFGEVRTQAHSLRHDANIISITGTEIDYDGERVAFAAAVEAVRRASLRAVLYTSPSYSTARPRWRVLLPTSAPLPPSMRRGITAIANDVLGGVASLESFNLSQAFFYGQVSGNEAIQIEVIDGDFIDQRLPTDESDAENYFTRAGELYDLKKPIDVEARLQAMTHQGEGDAGINVTQLQVSAAMLNQGRSTDEVVSAILEATQRVAPGTWDWRREEAKIRRMCETWLSKRAANAAPRCTRSGARRTERPCFLTDATRWPPRARWSLATSPTKQAGATCTDIVRGFGSTTALATASLPTRMHGRKVGHFSKGLGPYLRMDRSLSSPTDGESRTSSTRSRRCAGSTAASTRRAGL